MHAASANELIGKCPTKLKNNLGANRKIASHEFRPSQHDEHQRKRSASLFYRFPITSAPGKIARSMIH